MTYDAHLVKTCFKKPPENIYLFGKEVWEAATLTERERCAKVCESLIDVEGGRLNFASTCTVECQREERAVEIWNTRPDSSKPYKYEDEADAWWDLKQDIRGDEANFKAGFHSARERKEGWR